MKNWFLALSTVLLLSGCGGGGSGSGSDDGSSSTDNSAGDDGSSSTDNSTGGDGSSSTDNSTGGDPDPVVNCGGGLPCSWISQDKKFRFCVSDADPTIHGNVYSSSGFLGEETLMFDIEGFSAFDSIGRQYSISDHHSIFPISDVDVTRFERKLFTLRINNSTSNFEFSKDENIRSVTLPFTSSAGASYNIKYRNLGHHGGVNNRSCDNFDFSGVPKINDSFLSGNWRCTGPDEETLVRLYFNRFTKKGTVRSNSLGGLYTGGELFSFGWDYDSRRLIADVDSSSEHFELTNMLRLGDLAFTLSSRVNGIELGDSYIDKCYQL